jgi:hypothetical protein
MNLGIYIDSLQEDEQFESLALNINAGIEQGLLTDASIFYDTIGHNTIPVKCGCFNSTDLWNFTGNLITTSVNSTLTALNIVNKFKIHFYHGWASKGENALSLIAATVNPTVKTLCRDEDGAKEFYRITGTTPVGIVNDFNLTEILQQVTQ